MNRFVLLTCVCFGLAALPVHADTPTCDALGDHRGAHIEIDPNLDFQNGDLVIRDDHREVMMITEERELFLRGKPVVLDDRGQDLVNRYYTTVEGFVDEAMDLAGDAAGLGVSAAIEALAAVFHGDAEVDAMEKRIEARAREIEAQADRMCQRFLGLEDIELEMQSVIPGFEPVVFATSN